MNTYRTARNFGETKFQDFCGFLSTLENKYP